MRRELKAPPRVNAGTAVNLEPTAGFEEDQTPRHVSAAVLLE
jgi:hypothetical protein